MAIQEIMQEVQSRLVTEIAQLWPLQGEWTEADYFALPDTNRLIELSEGNLIMPPHPTSTHQRVVGMLYRSMSAFVEIHDLGIVFLSPLPVRLWPGKIREPDVLFFLHAHADRIGEQIVGPPDLVVEVISPSTRVTDREEKFLEYARAGIPEYWIVDPDVQTVEVFVLRGQVYELLGRWQPNETAWSALLEGFQVEVSAIFAA